MFWKDCVRTIGVAHSCHCDRLCAENAVDKAGLLPHVGPLAEMLEGNPLVPSGAALFVSAIALLLDFSRPKWQPVTSQAKDFVLRCLKMYAIRPRPPLCSRSQALNALAFCFPVQRYLGHVAQTMHLIEHVHALRSITLTLFLFAHVHATHSITLTLFLFEHVHEMRSITRVLSCLNTCIDCVRCPVLVLHVRKPVEVDCRIDVVNTVMLAALTV